jgi:NAD(P)H-nitrite reductase large subunit
VCFRFIASTELSRQAGAEHDFSPLAGEWVARVDASCRTSRPGIYAAGEVTGVAGADAAILTGAIAAHAILQDLGRTREQGDAPALKGLRRRQSDERAFIEYLRRVGACSDDLLAAMLTDDTTVCKCQNLSAGELRATLRANRHIDDVNSLKLVSRVGMGLCQGRYCGSYARLVLAQARAGDRAAAPRPFTAQMPIKPVLISDLLDADRAAIEK